MKPNIIDNVVSFFDPQAGAKRIMARAGLERVKQFGYRAASPGRRRDMAETTKPSDSSRTTQERMRMISEARQLEQNFFFVRRILRMYALYVVGRLKYQAQTGDRSIDRKYEEYFSDWCNNCDVSNRFTFQQMLRLAIISKKRDGDCGFLRIQDADGNIKLQGIEADIIGGLYETSNTDEYISGVQIDPATGAPIGYWLYNRTIYGGYTRPVEMTPASNFIHYYDPMRFDQYRGVTALASAIDAAADIDEIIQNEIIAQKFASSLTGLVTTKTGEAPIQGYFEDQTYKAGDSTTSAQLQAIQAGTINYLSEGEDIKMFQNDRPAPAWQGFVQMMIRHIALSLDLTYGFTYDMGGMTGPSARFDSAQAQRVFQDEQDDLQRQILNPIKNLVIMNAIAKGILPESRSPMGGYWTFGAHPTIDIGRESQANLAENKQGLRSAARILGEQGVDWQDEQEQIKIEAENILRLAKDLSDKNDIKYESALSMIQMLTPNAPTQPITRDANQEKPALITSIGIGGIQSLTEILNLLGAGQIPAETALNVLETVFGMDEISANKILAPYISGQFKPPLNVASDNTNEPFKKNTGAVNNQ